MVISENAVQETGIATGSVTEPPIEQVAEPAPTPADNNALKLNLTFFRGNYTAKHVPSNTKLPMFYSGGGFCITQGDKLAHEFRLLVSDKAFLDGSEHSFMGLGYTLNYRTWPFLYFFGGLDYLFFSKKYDPDTVFEIGDTQIYSRSGSGVLGAIGFGLEHSFTESFRVYLKKPFTWGRIGLKPDQVVVTSTSEEGVRESQSAAMKNISVLDLTSSDALEFGANFTF